MVKSQAFSLKALNSTGSDEVAETVQDLITKLLIQNSRQHRVSILVAAAFSLTGSLFVLWSIWYDAYSIKAGQVYSRAQKRSSILNTIHPAEVFPFFTALATVIQLSIFIGVQSGTLDSFWVKGCARTAQLIWPAVWIVSLTILIFSLETTFRSLRRNRFRPRGNWDTPICLALIVLLTIGLWLSAFLMPSRNLCPGNLIWWTPHYSRIAVVLASGIIFTHLISAAVISIQLWKTIKMDRDERIAATRIVYSLGMNVVILTFIIPYWIEVVMREVPNQSSKIADIALTLSGLLNAALHIILRANSERLAIRPRQTPWTKKRRIRLFGPNDLNVGMFISTPLLAEPNTANYDWQKADKKLKPEPITGSTSPVTQYATEKKVNPKKEQPFPLAKPPTTAQRRAQTKSSYSIFPTQASDRPPMLSWMTNRSNSSEEIVNLPLPFFAKGHRREESSQTSATVEIGLRLSHAIQEASSPTSLNLPVHFEIDPRDCRASKQPQGAEDTAESSTDQKVKEPIRPPPPARMHSKGRWPIRDSFTALQQQRKRQMMKSLPPVPRDSKQVGPARANPLMPSGLRLNPPTQPAMKSPMKSPLREASTLSEASYTSPTHKSPTTAPPHRSPPAQPPHRSPTDKAWPLPLQPVQPSDNWI